MMKKRSIHVKFDHSKTTHRIINGHSISDEEWANILLKAAEKFADQEFERQCKGTSKIKNPPGILKRVK